MKEIEFWLAILVVAVLLAVAGQQWYLTRKNRKKNGSN
jgi:hypothetical protein